MMATIFKISHFLCIFIYVSVVNCETEPNILGIRLEKTDGKISYNEEGIITIEAGVDTRIQFLGVGLEKGSIIKFTTEKMESNSDCDKSNGSTPVMETAELELKAGGILLLTKKDIVYSSGKDTYYVT